MAFSYDAGSSTPTYAGLVEFNSVRLNDGTFKTHRVPPTTDSAPARDGTAPLAGHHGGIGGASFYEPWVFDLECWLYVPDPDYVPAALDYLRGAFSVGAGLLTLTVNARGWAAARQMTARVAGSIVVNEPDVQSKKTPRRDFTIPMVAPDPFRYSTTLHSTTITTSTSVTNAGNASAPFTVRFNGPQTNPQIDGPGGSSNRIRYVGAITSGHYVEVTTNPATATGVTVLDDTGANVYGDLSAFTADSLAPGASSWTATNDSGAGSTVLSWRDAWA